MHQAICLGASFFGIYRQTSMNLSKGTNSNSTHYKRSIKDNTKRMLSCRYQNFQIISQIIMLDL